ncbi:MAG TPA: DUF2959 family protein [Bryobacteraceae bacterium]|nr:DUF2959 family protein [Bryobacteraceae bacterium]
MNPIGGVTSKTVMVLRVFVPVLCLLLAGCNSLYYAGMEKLGKEKRDILVQRILAGKKDQQEAQKQIKTTLEAFQEVTGFQGGNLERVYKKLNGEFEDAEARAKDVSDRIRSIDQVASDMFREWDKEIGQMRNSSLRASSRSMLRDAQQKHKIYMASMRRTERSMQPIIAAFRDQVLFLKHNLNARAIRSLQNTAKEIDSQVTVLVQDMERSIQESDAFVQTLNSADVS